MNDELKVNVFDIYIHKSFMSGLNAFNLLVWKVNFYTYQ